MVGQDRPGAQIWTSRPNLKSLADLRGQQIGVQSRGDTGELAVLSLLKRAGLPRDYVSFTPMGTGGTRLAALRSKALPAVLLNWFEIAELRPSDLSDAHPLIDLYSEVRMPYNGLATSDDLIRNRVDLLHRVIRASLKGVGTWRSAQIPGAAAGICGSLASRGFPETVRLPETTQLLLA